MHITRIAFWNAETGRFSDYQPTTHRSLKEATSTFLLATTCIRNAAQPAPIHPGSRCTGFWAMARVELVKSNGAVRDAFALSKSDRNRVLRGIAPKQASAKEPVWLKPGNNDSLSIASNAVL